MGGSTTTEFFACRLRIDFSREKKNIYIYMEPDGPCVYKWLLRLDDSTTEREAFDVVFLGGGRF